MNNKVFITGSSLVCSLGNNKEDIISAMRELDSENYETLVRQAGLEGSLYRIAGFSHSATEKYYQVLAYVVAKAIQAANLTKEMQEELAIFIGSTSMKISTDEDELVHLGNSVIGEFIVHLTHAKHGFYIVSTACTSSANAMDYAAKMIKYNKIKRALVVGIEFLNQSTSSGFEAFMLLSKEGIYRPFDENSDGIILGEACSALILDSCPRSDADFAYLGSANVCDNTSETTSNLNGLAVFRCLNDAIQDAKLNVEDIDIIKAHATGTANNNLAEIKGLDLFLQGKNTPICALKPFIGHTLGACGINEIVLLLMCIEHGFIPRMCGLLSDNGLPFNLLKDTLPIDQKVNILFNYIGFSGNNTAIVLGR